MVKKETNKEIKQQVAEEISKDIFNIFDDHIKQSSIYANGEIVQIKSTVNDVSVVINSITDLFKNKYGVKVGKSLNNYTWQEIKNIADEGNAYKIFNVGDTKTIELYTGEVVEAVILGFNHDKISNSTCTAGITFGLKNMLDGEYEMNEDDTNVGGWAKSKMRNVYMQRFFKLLPTDLQKYIKTVDKTTGIGGGSEQTEITQDKLFLFSNREVTNSDDYCAPNEGVQYPYFRNKDNFIKERACSANFWWLRSPLTGGTTFFRYIGYYGSVDYLIACHSFGVSFGFCI